jgi:hypothetical protein
MSVLKAYLMFYVLSTCYHGTEYGALAIVLRTIR